MTSLVINERGDVEEEEVVGVKRDVIATFWQQFFMSASSLKNATKDVSGTALANHLPVLHLKNFNYIKGCTCYDCHFAHACNRKGNGKACACSHPTILKCKCHLRVYESVPFLITIHLSNSVTSFKVINERGEVEEEVVGVKRDVIAHFGNSSSRLLRLLKMLQKMLQALPLPIICQFYT